MQLLLVDAGCEPFLLDELARCAPGAAHQLLAPGLVAADLAWPAQGPPRLVFARQLLPDAEAHEAASIAAWAQRLAEAAVKALPEREPWRLHVAPHYALDETGRAGENRCRLIREALQGALRRRRRSLLRALEPEPKPFAPGISVVQLLLTAPERGWLSLAPAPLPFRLRSLLSPFPKGAVPPARDKAPPSRAFAKLLEAEARLGVRIAARETCVDLGASPGSWSYVALARGARVVAVDRTPLRDDLMRHPRLAFQRGDAFRFTPAAPVDWLLCDVVAAPARSIDLLLAWARERRMRRFVVSLKLKGHAGYAALDALKQALPPLCDELYLTRLCANKNEACAFGTLAGAAAR